MEDLILHAKWKPGDIRAMVVRERKYWAAAYRAAIEKQRMQDAAPTLTQKTVNMG